MPSPAVVSNLPAAAAAIVGYCFEVQIAAGSANTYQGTTATVTWTFTAQSVS